MTTKNIQAGSGSTFSQNQRLAKTKDASQMLNVEDKFVDSKISRLNRHSLSITLQS